jgi:hypothetical protein
MAEEQTKKRKKYPIGAIFWGTIGVAAVARALYRPHRALIRDGFVSKCAATTGCEPSMTVDAFEGTQAIFAPMAGNVVSTGPHTVYIVPNGEAVLLEYTSDSASFTPQVAVGEKVGSGQQLGLASRIRFAVYEILRTQDGSAKIGAALEPASWLAVHGIRVSSKKHPATENWCEGGRKIVAPANVANCLKLPPPSGYALLPISVTTG